MALTGLAGGPPLLAPGPIASCARATVDTLTAIADRRCRAHIDGAALLGERAAIAGFVRSGAVSAGGSCRLLRARDGHVAVSLARPEDFELIPAWIGETSGADAWTHVARRVAARQTEEVVARARLLGLAVAAAARPPRETPPWYRVAARGSAVARSPLSRPLVVDLSSLWAGPLCASLLENAGARVIKVESTRRPDGARRGPAAFYDLMNAGKESVALDFTDPHDRQILVRLIDRADIVVESARPRALRQLGIDAVERIERRPGLTWVSITGYGRDGDEADWIAFGDDAAVAAGTASALATQAGTPVFLADAIADPLTGIHSALAALAAFDDGGGLLLDLSLRDVTAHALVLDPAPTSARVAESGANGARRWEVAVGEDRQAVEPPRARSIPERARPLGADTRTVLAELGLAC